MGTLTLRRFRQKVRAFELYLAQGLFARHAKDTYLEVVVLTHSTSRLRNLREAARKEVAQDRWGHYLFATLDVLDKPDAAGFDDTDWETLVDDDPQWLVDRRAFAADTGEDRDAPNQADKAQGGDR